MLNATGWFVSGTGFIPSIYQTKSYDYQEYFIASFEQGEIHFNPPKAYYNNTLVTSAISIPIKSDTGERVGVLQGTMWLNDLIHTVATYPLNEGEIVYLVDKSGTVVAHSEIDLFALEKGVLSLNYSALPLVQSIMTGETKKSFEHDHDGVYYIGTNTIIESNNWGVVVETPKDNIMAESIMLSQNLWNFNIVLFVSALAVSLFFTHQTTIQSRRLQEKLSKSEKLAAIGQLASTIGHELRNPLGVISKSRYFLDMRLKNVADEKVKKHLKFIEREVNSSNLIIGDLLDFARKKPLTLKQTKLNDVVTDALNHIFIPKNIKVKTKLDEILLILLDSEKIRRVSQNMILNAVQAMPEGGNLSIQTMKNEDLVKITITDTGVGILERNMSKIFIPLFSTKTKGVGLGLVICKQIVEDHGGEIIVKSKVGKGSTFTVKLPIHIDKAEDEK